MEITKTQKYLFPALYFGYDYDFKLFLKELAGSKTTPQIRLNSYIGDHSYNKITESCIFILLQVNEDFDETLRTFRDHVSFVDDYEVGDFDSNYHMVVCRINNEKAYNYFMISRYSKMYSAETLEDHFCLGIDSKTKEKKYVKPYHVFKKTKERKAEIISRFTANHEKATPLQDFDALEYEGKISMFKEIFDFRKLK
jgi:hypothetical protein